MSHPFDTVRKPDPPSSWEPALGQVRSAGTEALDLLARRWLAALGLSSLLRWPRPDNPLTYSALAGAPGLPVQAQVQIFRQRTRLQAHHVEAFAGRLAGAGCGAGILVGLGGYTLAAARAARSCRSPHVRLLSGEDWLAELAHLGAGVRRANAGGWALDLAATPERKPAPGPNGPRW